MCASHSPSELDNLMNRRHSLAHLLAAAVIQQYPEAKLTLGPAIDQGFYYDVDFGDIKVGDGDIKALQTIMRKSLKNWREFTGRTVSIDEAREHYADNPYKLELINEINERGEDITLYTCAEFTDLCRGGHVDGLADIDPKSFQLDRVAGAYWRGDEKNPMLTRIYGLAFESAEELQTYLKQREEAKERDHKKIGKELGLFAFSELVGRGLPMFLPKGQIVRDQLAQYMIDEKKRLGYQFVCIPHIAKRELYERSGHMGKYDAMMPTMTDQNGEEFVMKAMNCPHHFELYNAEPHSYRDLPIRYAENTVVYRNEKSGELSGLLRVKALTQDDTHHFVREDQIEDEIEMILDLMQRVYSRFGFSDFHVEISVRDSKQKDSYFGGDELWERAEGILLKKVKEWGVPYSIEEGEAAFYGPKIDIRVKDAIGRSWQLTTVQLDFNQPENFHMIYTGQDGQEHKVVVLHVAILGSLERFLGVLLEHYAGFLPLWLAPVQIAVLPVNPEAHGEYAESVRDSLVDAGFRVDYYGENDSLGKRIRSVKGMKIPYQIVIGDEEVSSQTMIAEGRENSYEKISVAELITSLQEEANK